MSELAKIARKHKPIKQYLRSFLIRYEQLFSEIRMNKLTILEIGVGGYKNEKKGGGSLRMWAEYFPNSIVVGLDCQGKQLQLPPNANFEMGSQTDVNLLLQLSNKYGGFDIVIDDASHVTKNTIISFNALFEQTRKFYIIEDLHMVSSKGTTEYFLNVTGSDFETKNLCVIKK